MTRFGGDLIYQTANQMSIPADVYALLVKQIAAFINSTSSDNIGPPIKFTSPHIGALVTLWMNQ